MQMYLAFFTVPKKKKTKYHRTEDGTQVLQVSWEFILDQVLRTEKKEKK